MTEFVLARKKPVEATMVSISARSAPALLGRGPVLGEEDRRDQIDPDVRGLRERIVATSSSSGVVKSSSQCASG